MSVIVLDASVAAKLCVREPDSDRASEVVRAAGDGLAAPDLLWAEVASVLWKRVRRGDLGADAAVEALELLMDLPVRIEPIDRYAASALRIALATGRSVYDGVYIAMAAAEGGVLVTADERLVNGLAGTPLAAHVRWLHATA